MEEVKLEWYVLNSTSRKSEFDKFPYCFHDTDIRPWNVFDNWVFREAAIKLAEEYLDGKLGDEWVWCDDYPKEGDLFEQFKFKLIHELQHEEWSRCEYEICVAEWPPVYVGKDGKRISVYSGQEHEPIEDVKMDKVDTYSQVLPNLDIFAKYVLETVKESRQNGCKNA